MSTATLFILMALVAGISVPTQAGINAQLGLWTKSPVLAATISFAVGTLTLVAYTLVARIPLPALAGSADIPGGSGSAARSAPSSSPRRSSWSPNSAPRPW